MAILLLSGCELFTSNLSQSKEEQAEKAMLTDNADRLAELLNSGLPNTSRLLDFAITHKAQKSAMLLIKKGAQVFQDNFDKAYADELDTLVVFIVEKLKKLDSVLHRAVKDGRTNLVHLILTNHSRSVINHQDVNKNTALDLRIKALDSQRPENDTIFKFLCDHGAIGQTEFSKYSCFRGWKNGTPTPQAGPSVEECIAFFKQEDTYFKDNWDSQISSQERMTISKKRYRALTKKFHPDLHSSEKNREEKMQKTTECHDIFLERL